MCKKKDPYKFTIQFNPSDPTHQQTVVLLNQQGRRKAQLLVNAVMHYIHCSQTPDIPQTPPVDTALIETIVRKVLRADVSRKTSQTLSKNTVSVICTRPDSIRSQRRRKSGHIGAVISISTVIRIRPNRFIRTYCD